MMATTVRRLRRSSSGATAIEYAIIAALIGLGIVASLVSTKGSLNATFGRVSGQMASATGASAPLSVAAYWNAKTPSYALSQDNGYGGLTYTFNYADGSVVRVINQPQNSPPLAYQYNDPVANQMRQVWYDANGGMIMFQVSQYAGGPYQTLQSVQTGQNNGVPLTGDPPSGSSMGSTVFDQNGNYVKTVNSVDSVFNTAASRAADEKAYFDARVRSQ